MPILAWNVFLICPIFVNKYLVFPILSFSSFFLHCSFKKVFLSLLLSMNSEFIWVYLSLSPLLFCFFPFLSKSCPRQPFCLVAFFFSLGWFWSLPPIQCYEPPSIVLQALHLPDLVPLICWSPPLYNHKGSDLGHTWMANGFQIGKGVHPGCILSPCLFKLYAEYIMRNAGLDEAQAGIKIARRNINNLRYADDTTLTAES